MLISRNFLFLTLADFIVRSAYQMGKTPLLPIFAATLGASDAYLGFIVSVSTLTGMTLKPLIGFLSDRWGRYPWLLLGTSFFVVMPFLYHFVSTPEQLVVIRIIHGLATAIYGPVTLAYIAEQSPRNRAERLGWFGMARSSGYIVGPGAAGWLLLTADPVAVFTAIGWLSSLAFVPILLLPKPAPFRPRKANASPSKEFQEALKACSSSPSVWLSGSLEAGMYVATYAVKAFLPIYALSLGVSVFWVGSFFAVQEAVQMVVKPFGGRWGDRLGYLRAIALGMALLGIALLALTATESNLFLASSAILGGLGQALITPSVVALVSTQAGKHNLGASMGAIGTLKNGGKVLGPILAGALLHWLDFGTTFQLMGGLLLCGAIATGASRFCKNIMSKEFH